MKEDKEFIFSFIPFLFLFTLTLFGLVRGLIHEDKFLYVLLILAFFSPSPYRLYVKVKDLFELGRNGRERKNNSTVVKEEEVTGEDEKSNGVDTPMKESEEINGVGDNGMEDVCGQRDISPSSHRWVRAFQNPDE